MALKTEITKIHYDKNSKGFLFSMLKFLSLFYGVGAELKNFLYDKNILKPNKVDAYVVSVGNITTGGVGKTPVVCEIAKYLISQGEKVAIISRGYGGELSNKNINLISDGKQIFYSAKDSGDEPNWLAQNSAGAIVVTSKNRIKASEYAIKKFEVTKIILDDGFQHRKLHRDLDIVLIDSEKELGNGKLLPAGPLREIKKSLRRADKLVIVSKNTDHSKTLKLVENYQKSGKKALICKTEPDFVYNIKSGRVLDKGSEVVALSAIGQPEQFYKFLSDYKVKSTKTFDDHHIYEKSDIENIKDNIITTEKDAVKLAMLGFDNIYALKLKTIINVENLLSD